MTSVVKIKQQQNHGFALVIALSLMAFLLLLTLSVTTLIRVEFKTAENSKSTGLARQNALLGLNNALGVLQATAGNDQRATATGDLWNSPAVGTENLVGVWSTEDNDGDGKPDGNFVRWLISNDDANSTASSKTDSLTFISTDRPVINKLSGGYSVTKPDYVALVGAGSVAQSDPLQSPQAVVAQKLPIQGHSGNTSGKYAWWVGDEGIKVRANLIADNNALYPTLSVQRSGVETIPNLNFIPQNDSALDKVSSNEELLMLPGITTTPTAIEKAALKENFHNLSFWSTGLHTDTKNGGLKQDLSLLFEMQDQEYDSSSGDFMTSIIEQGLDYLGAPGPKETLPLLFKQQITTGDGFIYGPSFDLLRDYYRLYKGIKPLTAATQPTLDRNWSHTYFPGKAWFLANGAATENKAWGKTLAALYWRVHTSTNSPHTNKIATIPPNSNGGRYYNLDSQIKVVRPTKGAYLPYLSRFTFFASTIASDPSGATGVSATGPYDVEMLLQPNIALHNPYNVRIEAPSMRFLISLRNVQISAYRGDWTNSLHTTGTGSIPSLLDTVFSGGYDNPNNQFTHADANVGEMVMVVPQITYDPGEIKVFTANTSVAAWASSLDLFEVGTNTNTNGGIRLEISNHSFPCDHDNNQESAGLELFKEIPATANFATKLLVENWFKVGYEIWNNDLGGYDTAGSYFAYLNDTSTGITGNNATLTSGLNTSLARPISEYIDNAIPNIVLDFFIKPLDFNDPNLTSVSEKTFPNFILSNPLAASFSRGGAADFEAGGLTNLIQIQSEHIGSNTLMFNLYTADGGTWGYNHGSFGSSRAVILEIPQAPLQSIGQLQHASLSANAYHPAMNIGNSFSSPYISIPAKTYERRTVDIDNVAREYVFYDLPYLSNESIWDRYYFSSIAPRSGDSSYSSNNPSSTTDPYVTDIPQLIDDVVNKQATFNNPRMHILPTEQTTAQVKQQLQDFQQSAGNLCMAGAFNINSASVEAWNALLAGYQSIAVKYYNEKNGYTEDIATQAAAKFVRQSVPANSGTPASTIYNDDSVWSGFLTLTNVELQGLAMQIVSEIRARASNRGGSDTTPVPCLTLAQFVNREPSIPSDSTEGLLQAAIDDSGINSVKYSGAPNFSTTAYNVSSDNNYPISGYNINTALVAPGTLTQADILRAIAPVISARSDTFKIRSYGETLDIEGDVESKAWCEAIVQRITQPVSPDSSDQWMPNDNLGRRFKIIALRWLQEDEV